MDSWIRLAISVLWVGIASNAWGSPPKIDITVNNQLFNQGKLCEGAKYPSNHIQIVTAGLRHGMWETSYKKTTLIAPSKSQSAVLHGVGGGEAYVFLVISARINRDYTQPYAEEHLTSACIIRIGAPASGANLLPEKYNEVVLKANGFSCKLDLSGSRGSQTKVSITVRAGAELACQDN